MKCSGCCFCFFWCWNDVSQLPQPLYDVGVYSCLRGPMCLGVWCRSYQALLCYCCYCAWWPFGKCALDRKFLLTFWSDSFQTLYFKIAFPLTHFRFHWFFNVIMDTVDWWNIIFVPNRFTIATYNYHRLYKRVYP